MTAVQELYDLTKNLYVVATDEKEKDTDKKISIISNFLDEREDLLFSIDIPSLKDEDKLILNKVVEMDKEISKNCKAILIGIQQKLLTTTKAKGTQKKYLNPYSQINQASRFFDKKK